MDKKVIFAVAGSGKTHLIIDQLELEKRSLVVTYTQANLKSLRDRVLVKFGYLPNNIRIETYFTFLYSFCFKPLLFLKYNPKGINYKGNPNRYIKDSDDKHYFDDYRRIYSNRISKLLKMEKVLDDVNLRLERYFDNLFIDEVQDFAGNDFDFLESVVKANIEMTFVGDFYQHTFKTSHDGNVNGNLHTDYKNYKKAFANMGVVIDTESLNKSYRCSPTICNFVTEKIGIEIFSHRSDETKIYVIQSETEANEIFQKDSVVKLFYEESHKYDCYSRNWGECKGEDNYEDICVVLNKNTLDKFQDRLYELPPQTKNKLYVACTRSKKDLYFAPYYFYEKYKTASRIDSNYQLSLFSEKQKTV